MLGMAYYIYENWRAWRHKAIIHRGSCGHCNNGQGRNEGNYDPNNGAWHGPYADLQEAQEAQEEMPVEVHGKCPSLPPLRGAQYQHFLVEALPQGFQAAGAGD